MLILNRAVIDIHHNLEYQEVFYMVRRADLESLRNVGIITKYDILLTGDEAQVGAICGSFRVILKSLSFQLLLIPIPNNNLEGIC